MRSLLNVLLSTVDNHGIHYIYTILKHVRADVSLERISYNHNPRLVNRGCCLILDVVIEESDQRINNDSIGNKDILMKCYRLTLKE